MQTLMVCTSCKTSYNVLNHYHDCHNFGACWVDLWCGVWGFVDIGGRGGGEEVQEIESPNFRSPEVGISVIGAIP